MALNMKESADRRLSQVDIERNFASNDPSSNASLFGQDTLEHGVSVCADDERNWPRGWRPYFALAGCFFLMFNSWGIVNAYGTFLSYYQESLLSGHGPTVLNLIGSTPCFVVLSLSFIVGRLLDADHSRMLMVVGTCLTTLGMMLLSVVNGSGGPRQGNFALILVCQGIVQGLGMSCFFVTSSQVAATWFKKRKSFAIGIVASGASISGLVYPIMLRFIIRSHGFNFAVQMVGTLVLITSVFAVVAARPNPAHPPRKPEQWLAVRTFIDTTAFRHATFRWFTASICFLFFGFYAVFFNLEEWAASEGVGIKGHPEPGERGLQTYYLLAIMNGASTIGRLGSAYLCSHFNPIHVHCTVTLIASVLCFFLWTFADTLALAVLFVVTFGAFSGSVIGLPPASMASILHGDNEKLGQWTGMMYTASAPFALTGPVIAGHLISGYGYNFLTVQCWSGGCLLVSSFCMAMASVYDDPPNSSGETEGRASDPFRSRLGSLTPSILSFWSKKDEAGC